MKRFISVLLCLALLIGFCGCAGTVGNDAKELGSLTVERSMELSYAKNFAVDYCSGGYKLLTLADGSRYLLVPEGTAALDDIPDDIIVLSQPLTNIYMVATSVMSLFDALDALSCISLSGTRAENWYNENAKAAMQSGEIKYAGKYSEPDYELIVGSGCSLAIESTMISHCPEVKTKLNALGIPVLIDLSSSENHPLGRTEWIKLYGALLDREDSASAVFDEQAAYMQDAQAEISSGKSVAFFYISTTGSAVVRRSGDYIVKMIELAGGRYVFDELGKSDSGASTVSMEMESFYATAKNADYIIYNSTIGGEVNTLDELLQKSSLLADFAAVKNGNVWCTGKNLFQETTQLGLMTRDISLMLAGTTADSLSFLYRLK